MKKMVAVVALVAVLIAVSPLAAHAHGGAALALGAFAVFSVLTFPFWALAVAAQPVYTYPAPVYAPQPAYYATAPAVSYSAPPAPATPAIQREVIYPHGRHVLYGDGVTAAYRWVWVPNPPPPPAPAVVPPPPAGAPPPPPSR
jgi:hypothetical protein